jgi:bidirectional [NiFe] hydrogenase diaphorase subunit
MGVPGGGAAHPSGDDRFAVLDAAMRRQQYRADALLELLHVAQVGFGFLGDDVLRFLARGLGLPPSRVYGVATFYNLFTFAPRGRHTCTVCLGTACYVKGAGEILAGLEATHGARPGETSADGALSVVVARCIGACGAAVAVGFDDELAGGQTRASVLERVLAWSRP